MGMRWIGGFAVSLLLVGAIALLAARPMSPRPPGAVAPSARIRAERNLGGNTLIQGEVPLSVAQRARRQLVGPHPANATLKLNFGFPLSDRPGLEPADRAGGQDAPLPQPRRALRALLAAAEQHRHARSLAARRRASRSPTSAPTAWRSRRSATTAQVEQALHVKINDYRRPGYTFRGPEGRAVRLLREHAATRRCRPASACRPSPGLSDVDRFFTARSSAGTRRPAAARRAADAAPSKGRHRRAHRRLLPGRPAGDVRRHRPRLRRHRPDARLHALGRRRDASLR